MAEIIGMNGSKISNDNKPSVIQPGKFEFHLYPQTPEGTEEVIETEGYLKFGPQFIAVVDGPEDLSNVVFAVATNLAKYVKRVTEDGSVEATLSL